MAIDTHSRRRSTWGMLPFTIHAPVPDGTLDATDRAHVGGHYRGIAIGGSTPTPSGIDLTVTFFDGWDD